MSGIAACERVQDEFFSASAVSSGGRNFSTHRMKWSWLPDSADLIARFPSEITASGLRPALAEGARLGAKMAGIWVNSAVRQGELASFGFIKGWQPWWMTCLTDQLPPAPGLPGVELVARQGEDLPGTSWQVSAVLSSGQRAGLQLGKCLLFPSPTTPELGGVFEMAVQPEYQRLGIGTAMLQKLGEIARKAGISQLILNSTPVGLRLYQAQGFQLIGKGQTYWLELS
ncbi:GNAT family N-acetyltransferase [Psychromicrobium sp. YIM B11713]|uniref:GNAT family N-acetyltransferase n=1 Tax=Psychromicrobium sp. YIM B11713 TaxID=3145233 RepID=UPI00374E3A19